MLNRSLISKPLCFAALGTALIASGSAAQAQNVQCPQWEIGGVPIVTDAEQAWAPQRYTTFAGGMADLSSCGEINGFGHVTTAPSFSMTYDARNMGRDLEFRVESQCDTVLLINEASGAWSYNDDNDGLNAGYRINGAVSGRYDVWVGTYGDTACEATLVAETFGGTGGGGVTPAGGGQCPDWSLGGDAFRVAAGSNETRQVAAGGSLDMFTATCPGIDAHGYMGQAPSASFYFDPSQGQAPLNISVESTCDTLMLVNDPTTAWSFNDDSNNLMPAINYAQAAEGRYDVWVGTFGRNGCDATLVVNTGGAQGGGNK